MNRNALGFTAAICLFFGGGIDRAQPAATPVEPITNPVSRMHWKMTVQPESGGTNLPSVSSGAAREPKEVECARGLTATRVLVTYVEGETREYWYTGGGVISHDSSYRFQSDKFPAYTYSSAGFYGLENIKPSDRKGRVTYDKVPCLYYKGPRVPSAFEVFIHAANAGGSTYEAWFDERTGLPKVYKAQKKLFTFEFMPNLPDDLNVPPDVKAAVDKHKLNLRRAGLVK